MININSRKFNLFFYFYFMGENLLYKKYKIKLNFKISHNCEN